MNIVFSRWFFEQERIRLECLGVPPEIIDKIIKNYKGYGWYTGDPTLLYRASDRECIGRFEHSNDQSLLEITPPGLSSTYPTCYRLWIRKSENILFLLKKSYFNKVGNTYRLGGPMTGGRLFQKAFLLPPEKCADWLGKRGYFLPKELSESLSKAHFAFNGANTLSKNEAIESKKSSSNDLRPKKKPNKIALAIAILSQHPDWTNKQIADEVPCNEKYLSQNKHFKNARKAIKGIGEESNRRSKKHQGNDLDVYSDDDEG